MIASHPQIANKMEAEMYRMMSGSMQGGLHIPLNPPDGGSQNKRLKSRGGDNAAMFPESRVVEKPLNEDAK